MTDWQALARARELEISDDAIGRIAPALDALHEAFAPLLSKLPHVVEPAVILSEAAVLGLPASENDHL